jgi:hypothetical protein
MDSVDAITHWRSRVRQIEKHTDRVELDAATRKLIADLIRRIEALESQAAKARDAIPLVGEIVPEHVARIEALEAHATAQVELGEALRMVLMLASEIGKRTDKLEHEAAATHRTVATVLPVLAAARR